MEKQMAKYHVDRDPDYMYRMWGTTSLITDYWTKPHKTNDASELSKEELNARLKKQNELHEKIRNDADYDDWEYGTEPVYGKKG